MKLYGISFYELLPDIVNFLLISVFYCFLFKKYKIKKIFNYIAVFSFALPFFFYWLWDWSYLPDQSKYAHSIYEFRNFNFGAIKITDLVDNRVLFGSFLMSLFPIPFIFTIISVSMINKGILFAYIFLSLKNKMIPNSLIFFILFLPSYVVISSVALRDTIVIIIGIMFSYYFFKKRKQKKTLLFFLLFFFLKPHIAIFFFLIYSSYYFFFQLKINSRNRSIASIILIIFVIYIFYKFWYLVEITRLGFIAETFNYQIHIFEDKPVSFFLLLESFVRCLFLPISTGEINFANIVIFFENFVLLFFFLFYSIQIYKKNKFKALFWIIVLIMTLTFLGYLVINIGTLWRYKIVVYSILLFSMYFSANIKFTNSKILKT